MRHELTLYDQLRDLAHDLGASIIAGAVAPPMNGRMLVAGRPLEELLLPDGSACMVTLLIAPGGPPQHHIALGRGTLDDVGHKRLRELAATTKLALYEGRLALLTPADWIALHPPPEQSPDPVAPGVTDGARVHAGIPDSAGVEDNALIERAQARGWPANLSNGQWLFLDQQPLYHIMAKENVGRDVILVVARHAGMH
jgi:hypothetical protein